MKPNGHITFYAKLINDLSGQVKLISTKRLTKDLINWYSIINGANYFAGDWSQNHLVFQSVFRYFKTSANIMVKWWKSKDLSDGSIESPAASDDSLNLNLNCFNNPKFRVEFNESYVNCDTFFLIKNEFEMKIKLWRYYVSNGCTLQNSLFEAIAHIGFTLRGYLFGSD